MAYPPVLSKREWPFSPQSLPNCVIWLDAADTSTYNTASVAEWRNKGYAYGSTNGSGGFTSTNINGVPALSIAPTQSRTAPLATYTQTTRSVFTVTSSITTATTSIITSTTNTTDIQMYITSSGILNIQKIDTQLMTTNTNIQPVLSKPAICCATTTNTSSPSGATQGIFINGLSYDLSASATGAFGTTQTSSQSIGWGGNAQSFTLGEVLIFDGALTDIQRQQVEGYLAVKWVMQMQLPATHPYYASIQNPTQISGCLLWLDGADASTITQGIQPNVPPGNPPVITNWADKSGKSSYTVGSLTVFDATGQNFSSDYIYPKYDSLSKSAVFTFHSGFHTSLTTGVNSQNHCLIAVHKPTIDNCLFGFSSNFTFPPYQSKYSTPALSLACASSTSSINIIIANIANNVQTTYLNGSIVSSGTSTLSSTTTTTDLYIGNTGWDVRDVNNNLVNTAATFYSGNLYELIIYQSALTSSQITSVNNYLSNKWAVALSSPTTPIYANISNRPFQPVDITGCALWLDGMDRSSMDFSGSTISQWKDKSGNGYNATVATPDTGNTTSTYTATATYSTDPIGVYFPDKYTAYKTAYPANPTSETAFVVARNPNPSYNNNITVGGPSGARSICFGFHPDAANSCAYLNNALAWLSNTGANSYTRDTTAMVTGIIRPSGSNSSCTIAIKGGAMSNAVVAAFTSGAITCIGADTKNANNQFHYIGYIMEIIFYNRILSKSEILQVESHLSQKWNINSSLATTHPGYYLPAYSTTFTPKAITGLQLWLDAADASTIQGTASSVTGWTDKSGLGNDLSSNAGTPTYITDTSGYKALYLNGFSTMYRSPFSFGSADPFTIFIVGRVRVDTNNGPWFMTDANNSSAGYFPHYGNGITYVMSGTDFVTQTAVMSNKTTYMSAIVSGGTSGSELSFYVNAAKQEMTRYTVQGAFSRNDLLLGYRSAERMNGNIYEFIQYNTLLPPAQRQQVEGYLAWKWGTASSLPSTHPYAKFSP